MKPIILKSPLSERWYIATRYTVKDTHVAAHTKYDCTEEIEKILTAAQLMIATRDTEIASLKRDAKEWERVATSLRAQLVKYEDFLRNKATCPCCVGVDECDEECTFAEDCPEENESMWHVRDLLFGKEGEQS